MKKLFIFAVCFGSIIGFASNFAMANEIDKNNSISGKDAQIHVIRATTEPPAKGTPDLFTGDVSVARLFPANDPLKISGGYVTFQPGARTAWHSHPNGQLLIVTSGKGRVQQWGGPVIDISEGDVIWFPAGIKHWHGAAPDTALTHIALADIVDGKSSNWLELVTDEQYNR